MLERRSLARTFGFSEDIGKVARGCGAGAAIARRKAKAFPRLNLKRKRALT